MQLLERLPKESARDYALRTIKQNIITLDLAPGSMVSENELSAEMGLSRTPVREALVELSRNGIVEIYPQKGSRVAKIRYSAVEEARFLRLVLENAVVQLACDQAGPEDLDSLEENLKLQEFYMEHPSPEKLLALDNAFHQKLFLICDKQQCYALLDGMSTHFDRVRSMSLSSVKDLRIIEDHRAILREIKAKNKEAARIAMENHLSRYKLDETEIREKYPNCFE